MPGHRGAGCLGLVCCSLFASAAPEHLRFTLHPDVVRIDTFYNGARIRVEGSVGPAAQAVITVSGPECNEQFNVKGRMGPIWLNSGKVRISGVPTVLLVFSPGPLKKLLAPAVITEQHLDENSIRRRMRVEPRIASRDDEMRAGFLALKYRDGTYQLVNTGVRTGTPGSSGTPFSLEFTLPGRVPPAEYEVRLLEVREGQVAGQAVLPLRVVRAGFPAWLADLAEKRAATYGVAAVLISVLAGIGIDFLTTHLFRKKRSIAH